MKSPQKRGPVFGGPGPLRRHHVWLVMGFVFLAAGLGDAIQLRAHRAMIEIGVAWVMKELSAWRRV